MRNLLALVVVVAVASAVVANEGLAATGHDKLPPIPPIFVEAPFANPKAIDAFRRYVARVEKETHTTIEVQPDFYRAARLITYWGYEFEENTIGTYDVIFTQKFDVSSVFAALLTYVGKLREDDCSNWYVTDVRVTSMTSKEIDVTGAIKGTEMSCINLLVGVTKNKVGDIGGTATGRLTFRVDTSGDIKARYRGAFLANDPSVSGQAKATSVFGINTDSVVGQLITTMGHLSIAPVALLHNPTSTSMWESINIFNGSLWRAPSLAINDVVFAVADHGVIESARYREFLVDLQGVIWGVQPQFVISDSRSGLTGTPERPVLEVSFVATMKPHYPIETIEADIHREIDILKSFSTDEQSIPVSANQNFWKLSKQIYGISYYYSMLASANGLSRAQAYRVRAGKTIKAPPLYLLPFTPQVHFMRPGETIYGLCQKQFNGPVGKCVAAIARANPRLPLSHLYALEAVGIPALPNR